MVSERLILILKYNESPGLIVMYPHSPWQCF